MWLCASNCTGQYLRLGLFEMVAWGGVCAGYQSGYGPEDSVYALEQATSMQCNFLIYLMDVLMITNHTQATL